MRYSLIAIALATLFLFSCNENSFDVDVSDIDVKIEIERLDRDLFKNKPDSVEGLVVDLKNKYGDFFELYSQQIIKLGKTDQVVYSSYLKRFLIDYRIILAKEEINKIFPDLNLLELELTQAFKHYKYYFPDKNIPKFITCLTGFNQSIVLTNEYVAIALDKYLGSDCDLYGRLGVDKYKTQKMTKKMIPVDVMSSWIKSEYPYNDSIDNLATNMIYHGIIQYAVDAMLPDIPKETRLAYTEGQLYWAQKNEKKVWDYYKKHKLIYSTNKMDIAKFINDAPFTSTFTANSAPRTGVFIGREIVGAYMENHPEVSLEDLLLKSDYVDILINSKYNP